MKTRNILLGMVAFLMLFATSCVNDQDSGLVAEGTSMVSFSVKTPQIASRSVNPLTLQYAVYAVTTGEDESKELNELEGLRVENGVIEGGTANVKLNLMAGKTYSIIFWAAAEDAPYEVDFVNKKVTVNYENSFCNSGNGDAFFAYHEFEVSETLTTDITLRRPVAQLNVGTSDLDEAMVLNYDASLTKVKVSKLYTTLDLLDGTVGDALENVTFAVQETVAKSGIVFPVEGFDNLAMNYVLVGEKTTVDVEFVYTCGGVEETRVIGSVPLQRNYKTNIYGQILTKQVTLNIDLEDYEGEEFNEDLSVAKISETKDFEDALEEKVECVKLVENITYSGTINNEVDVNLNKKEFNIGSGIKLTSSLAMGDGKCIFDNQKYIDVRLAQPEVEEEIRTLTFENVDFINNYRTKTSNNSGTERVKEVLKITADYVGNTKVNVIFKNCTFDNARIAFDAQSGGKDLYIDVTFENCTFNALTRTEKLIEVKNYVKGVVNINKCTFNVNLTASNTQLIACSNSSNTSVTINVSNTTLKANKAVAYTYNSELGETEVDNVKIDYYGVSNCYLWDSRQLPGGYSKILDKGGNSVSSDDGITVLLEKTN